MRRKIVICEECLKFIQTSDMKGYPILLKMKFLESPCLPSSHLRFQILCRKVWESFELSQNSFLWMLLGNIRNGIRSGFLQVISPWSFLCYFLCSNSVYLVVFCLCLVNFFFALKYQACTFSQQAQPNHSDSITCQIASHPLWDCSR